MNKVQCVFILTMSDTTVADWLLEIAHVSSTKLELTRDDGGEFKGKLNLFVYASDNTVLYRFTD